MNSEHPLLQETLENCLTLALRGIDIDHWVAVHAVHGLEPGIHRSPRLDKPAHAGSQHDMRAQLAAGLAEGRMHLAA